MLEGQQALEQHLRSGRFLAGAAKGRWQLVKLDWPLAFIEVLARDGRRFALRFDCAGYPTLAPTATLWDMTHLRQLEASRWPRGGRVSQVFNPGWKAGTIYLPCDRVSFEGHSNWLSEHPSLIWNAERGLLQYIEAVCEILQSNELACESPLSSTPVSGMVWLRIFDAGALGDASRERFCWGNAVTGRGSLRNGWRMTNSTTVH